MFMEYKNVPLLVLSTSSYDVFKISLELPPDHASYPIRLIEDFFTRSPVHHEQ